MCVWARFSEIVVKVCILMSRKIQKHKETLLIFSHQYSAVAVFCLFSKKEKSIRKHFLTLKFQKSKKIGCGMDITTKNRGVNHKMRALNHNPF